MTTHRHDKQDLCPHRAWTASGLLTPGKLVLGKQFVLCYHREDTPCGFDDVPPISLTEKFNPGINRSLLSAAKEHKPKISENKS